MRYRSAALLAITLFLAATATAQTQAEVDAARNNYLELDKTLNTTYKAALAAMDGEPEARLVDAHEAWKVYRGAITESEASLYSEGNTRSLVYYNAMAAVTSEHLVRLKTLVTTAQTPVAAPEPPEPPDPQQLLTAALNGPAVTTLLSEMDARLKEFPHIRTYLDTVVPPANELHGLLAAQGLPEDYVIWIRDNPELGRRIVTLAVARDIDRRAAARRSDWEPTTVMAVTEALRRGTPKGALGAIGSELLLRPQAPYKLFEYLHKDNGLAILTGKLIEDALA